MQVSCMWVVAHLSCSSACIRHQQLHSNTVQNSTVQDRTMNCILQPILSATGAGWCSLQGTERESSRPTSGVGRPSPSSRGRNRNNQDEVRGSLENCESQENRDPESSSFWLLDQDGKSTHATVDELSSDTPSSKRDAQECVVCVHGGQNAETRDIVSTASQNNRNHWPPSQASQKRASISDRWIILTRALLWSLRLMENEESDGVRKVGLNLTATLPATVSKSVQPDREVFHTFQVDLMDGNRRLNARHPHRRECKIKKFMLKREQTERIAKKFAGWATSHTLGWLWLSLPCRDCDGANNTKDCATSVSCEKTLAGQWKEKRWIRNYTALMRKMQSRGSRRVHGQKTQTAVCCGNHGEFNRSKLRLKNMVVSTL